MGAMTIQTLKLTDTGPAGSIVGQLGCSLFSSAQPALAVVAVSV